MLAPLLFINILVSMETNKRINSRQYMIALTLFTEVTLEYSYLSMKDEYQTLYVSSYCLFTSFTVTDTIQ